MKKRKRFFSRSKKSYVFLDFPRHYFEEINTRFHLLKNRFFLPDFLREMKRLKIGGMSGGNSLRLLTDGNVCFGEFIRAIKSARTSINLETYIFNSDETGWEIAGLLAGKARDGVEVNVIYDAVGCLRTSPALFQHMKQYGVELIEYHPLVPWRKYWNISFRDHRKILVVDGKTAFLGGINIGNDYAGKRAGGEEWRDTHLRIEGPAVRDIQFYFIENWFRNGGVLIDNNRHFPSLKDTGKKLLMVLSSRSRRNVLPIQQSYLSAIKYAKSTIYITNAYFIPDAKIYRALVRAARRGVDVRVLLPEKSDVPIVKYASRYLYKKYLKHRIRVFEYTKSVLHAKTAVVDGIWSTVGSSNLDRISFRRNLEVNAIILDQEFGEKMERTFFGDLKRSRELSLDHWVKRFVLEYIAEWVCYRFRNLL